METHSLHRRDTGWTVAKHRKDRRGFFLSRSLLLRLGLLLQIGSDALRDQAIPISLYCILNMCCGQTNVKTLCPSSSKNRGNRQGIKVFFLLFALMKFCSFPWEGHLLHYRHPLCYYYVIWSHVTAKEFLEVIFS